MLSDIILFGFYRFLSFILSPIINARPVALDSGMGAALQNIGGAIAVLNVVLDISLLIFVVVGVHVIVEGYIFGYKLLRWAYQKIPGIN